MSIRSKTTPKTQFSPKPSFAQSRLLQRRSANYSTYATVPPIVQNVLRSLGQPLDPTTRTFMEPRFGHDFSKVSVHSTKPGMIQTKLKINEPGDIYEQEADRVTEHVLRMPEPQVQRQIVPEEEEKEEMLQTKTMAEQITPLVQRQIEPEEEEEEVIQRERDSKQTSQVDPGMEAQIHSAKSGGLSLPRPVRNFFEPRLGYDFSQVRVHVDTQAASLATVVKARAFTLGHDIVFGAGQYAPSSVYGQKLIAHELTHVVQQGGNCSTLMRWDTPQEIIGAYTTLSTSQFMDIRSLNENGLGCELCSLVIASHDNIDFVLSVFDALPWAQGDDVAYAFVSPLTTSQIESIAFSDRGRMLLLRLRDEMLSPISCRSESRQALRLLEILESITRLGAEAVEPVAGLPRKTMQLKIVKYRDCTLDLDNFRRRTDSIFLDQCGIEITYRITNADSTDQTEDLGEDAVIDLTTRGNDVEGNNVKRRVSYGGTNYVVPIAFVKDIRMNRTLGLLEGFTPPGGPCAVCNRARTNFETLAHEICVFYGMLDLDTHPERLRYGEGSRTDELLLPFECSEFRRRL